jgi:hypothetical protein
MPTITEDAIWTIAATARHAAESKSEWITSSAKIAAELAVGVVADLAIDEFTDEDRKILMRRATMLATERISDLVADVAEELADDYF